MATADTAPLTAEEEASLRTALTAGDLWPTAQAASILPVLLATLDHERGAAAEHYVRLYNSAVADRASLARRIEALPKFEMVGWAGQAFLLYEEVLALLAETTDDR